MKYTIRTQMEDGKYWKFTDCENIFNLIYWLNYLKRKVDKKRIAITIY